MCFAECQRAKPFEERIYDSLCLNPKDLLKFYEREAYRLSRQIPCPQLLRDTADSEHDESEIDDGLQSDLDSINDLDADLQSEDE